MSTNAFIPTGSTQFIAATTVSSTAIQITPAQTGGASGSMQYRIVNLGPNKCFIVLAAAAAAAVIPTAGVPANGVCILNGTAETLTGPPNAFFTTICAATESASMHITPGDGL